MRNRKRRNVQPTLESMETRVVPSTVGVGLHHARVATAHIHRAHETTAQSANNQNANNEALKKLQQQLALIHTHSLEHTPSARETPAEKVTTETSSLFKSIFASL
jgi:hypothetical protein